MVISLIWIRPQISGIVIIGQETTLLTSITKWSYPHYDQWGFLVLRLLVRFIISWLVKWVTLRALFLFWSITLNKRADFLDKQKLLLQFQLLLKVDYIVWVLIHVFWRNRPILWIFAQYMDSLHQITILLDKFLLRAVSWNVSAIQEARLVAFDHYNFIVARVANVNGLSTNFLKWVLFILTFLRNWET